MSTFIYDLIGLGAGVRVGRDARHQTIAGGMQHRVAVAGGQHHVVEKALGRGREAEGLRGGQSTAAAAVAAAGLEHRQGAENGQSDAATQQAAARDAAGCRAFQDILEVFVGGCVGDLVGMVCHGVLRG